MDVNEAQKPWKAKLRLELESPEGNVRIYILPHLEFGPGIYYWDSEEARETTANIGQYSEVKYSNDPLSILKKPESHGRDFYELNLFAIMKNGEVNGLTAKMFELAPERMDDEQKKLWKVEE